MLSSQYSRTITMSNESRLQTRSSHGKYHVLLTFSTYTSAFDLTPGHLSHTEARLELPRIRVSDSRQKSEAMNLVYSMFFSPSLTSTVPCTCGPVVLRCIDDECGGGGGQRIGSVVSDPISAQYGNYLTMHLNTCRVNLLQLGRL